MSLPYGLLGLLETSSNTGYGLAKMFETSIKRFWQAKPSQIYRELNRMEEKGWVSSVIVPQEGKPNQRLYSVTEEGRKNFRDWLNNFVSFPTFVNQNSPLLMYILFGSHAPEATLARLKAVRDTCFNSLEKEVPKTQELINHLKATMPNGEKRAIYWQMCHDFGVAQAKAYLEWAEEAIKKLEKELSC